MAVGAVWFRFVLVGDVFIAMLAIVLVIGTMSQTRSPIGFVVVACKDAPLQANKATQQHALHTKPIWLIAIHSSGSLFWPYL